MLESQNIEKLNEINNINNSYLVIKQALSNYHVSIVVQVNEIGHINVFKHEIDEKDDHIAVVKPKKHIFKKENFIKHENGYDIYSNQHFYLYHKVK